MKLSVYVPDELGQRVKAAGLPIAAVCQQAMRNALGELTPEQRIAQLEEQVRVLQEGADLSERLREHAYRIAGGSGNDPNYDPETLCLETEAADEIDRLRRMGAT